MATNAVAYTGTETVPYTGGNEVRYSYCLFNSLKCKAQSNHVALNQAGMASRSAFTPAKPYGLNKGYSHHATASEQSGNSTLPFLHSYL